MASFPHYSETFLHYFSSYVLFPCSVGAPSNSLIVTAHEPIVGVRASKLRAYAMQVVTSEHPWKDIHTLKSIHTFPSGEHIYVVTSHFLLGEYLIVCYFYSILILDKYACCASGCKEKKLAFSLRRSIQFSRVATCFLRKIKKVYNWAECWRKKHATFHSGKSIQFFRHSAKLYTPTEGKS